jgi:hypothetical protein
MKTLYKLENNVILAYERKRVAREIEEKVRKTERGVGLH